MRKINTAYNILNSFKLLKGNTRTCVVYEPFWGIPFVLFNFYLSLYMKELGVTNVQLGYIISIGYIAGTLFSLISGAITDRLGRKRTTLIFDLISWPLTVVIYFISNSFVLFALATITNSMNRIVTVSWNLMMVEEADNEQRVAAYNIVNIINIASGVVIPLTGILVSAYGIIISERIFLAFAAVSMTAMMLYRNRIYKETSVGRHNIEERKKNPSRANLKKILPVQAAKMFKGNTKAIIAAIVYILFFTYIPLGTFNSLYFAPFMTEALGLGKSSISILGGVYSGVLLFVFVLINPIAGRLNHTKNMQVGLAIQAAALIVLILIPAGSLPAAVIFIIAYAAGFGIFRPYVDSMLAEVSEGNERAGVYSMVNTITCIATAVIGFISGSIYLYNPRLIYVASIIILAVSIVLLEIYYKLGKSGKDSRLPA